MSNPFFRVRLKLFKEKKFGQFFAISFFEVLLIVFGILLALQIDNWNQKRISEKKIDHLLAEIASILSDEISLAESTIDFLIRRDSIIQKVKEKRFKAEDFKSPTMESPQYAVLTYRTLSINRNPYENLIRISDEIPAKYDILFADLNTLYEKGGGWLKEREEKLLDKFYPFQEDLRRNKVWWSDIFQFKELDNEAIEYFLNDPIYLNWVYEIDNDLEGLREAIEWYREAAININRQITEFNLEL